MILRFGDIIIIIKISKKLFGKAPLNLFKMSSNYDIVTINK